MSERGCEVEDCSRKHKGHGYCEAHLKQKKKHGETFPVRSKRVNPTTCKKCGVAVPRNRKGYYLTQCRRCHHLAMFGLTKESYADILLKQGGGCAICGETEGVAGRSLHVDHDRNCCNRRQSCGKCVRGILCSGCNTALGLLGEKNLEAAIGYLRRYAKDR